MDSTHLHSLAIAHNSQSPRALGSLPTELVRKIALACPDSNAAVSFAGTCQYLRDATLSASVGPFLSICCPVSPDGQAVNAEFFRLFEADKDMAAKVQRLTIYPTEDDDYALPAPIRRVGVDSAHIRAAVSLFPNLEDLVIRNVTWTAHRDPSRQVRQMARSPQHAVKLKSLAIINVLVETQARNSFLATIIAYHPSEHLTLATENPYADHTIARRYPIACHLRTLTVDCATAANSFILWAESPFHLMPRYSGVEELEVRGCTGDDTHVIADLVERSGIGLRKLALELAIPPRLHYSPMWMWRSVPLRDATGLKELAISPPNFVRDENFDVWHYGFDFLVWAVSNMPNSVDTVSITLFSGVWSPPAFSYNLITRSVRTLPWATIFTELERAKVRRFTIRLRCTIFKRGHPDIVTWNDELIKIIDCWKSTAPDCEVVLTSELADPWQSLPNVSL